MKAGFFFCFTKKKQKDFYFWCCGKIQAMAGGLGSGGDIKVFCFFSSEKKGFLESQGTTAMLKKAKYLLPLLVAPAFAQSPVAVHDAWARATAPGQTSGAVYMSLTSPSGDTLTGVSSPDAGAAMLHKTSEMNGMSGMSDMESLPLPAGREVTLAPHGMHVMLMDLKHPLVPGQSVEVDITFAKSPGIHVKVPVQPISASAPPA